jgi:hypothetical protein
MDAQDGRIHDFSYLRVNRFLSSFRDQIQGAEFEQWLDLMQALGMSGWALEYANLAPESQALLVRQARTINDTTHSFLQILNDCANQQRQTDFAAASSASNAVTLRQQAAVKDNYSLLKRTLGLYPLTAFAFRIGIAKWHGEVLEDYITPLSQLKTTGVLTAYTPVSDSQLSRVSVQKILRQSASNPLAIPQPDEQDRIALFSTYAPHYLVDQASSDDQFGFPRWTADNELSIDLQSPVVFNYLSWTRFHGRALLQLNYLAWFPARTAKGRFDILAGNFDGLLWRVTLQSNGEPLVFDSIHACGCYHLFYTGNLTESLPPPAGLQEPAFFPSQQGYSFVDLPLSLHIGAGNHYLRRVASQSDRSASDKAYKMYSAKMLRSLPGPGLRRRSLYQPDSLVQETHRPERILFWPMGIASPGAMRQRGHHATAFTGRRHFDDANLFDFIISLEAE